MLIKTKKGDTIVEAVFAFAIFGFIAISSILIMRQGMAKTQTALEINLVRAQINAQAEALRYLHSAAISDFASDKTTSSTYDTWSKITTDRVKDTAPVASSGLIQGSSCTSIDSVNPKAFVLNPRDSALTITASPLLKPATNYSRLIYEGAEKDDNMINLSTNLKSAEGIWVEGIKTAGTASNKGYYDFYIRACWPSISGSVPNVIETVVRLYDFK